MVRALMVGDVVGPSGLAALHRDLRALIARTGANIVVANGENARSGFGIGPEECAALREAGVDVISSGNHVWEGKDARAVLDAEPDLLRPANFPSGAPGRGWIRFAGRAGASIHTGNTPAWVVLNLQGRESMTPIDCPFRSADRLLEEIRAVHPDALVIVDFHAESSEEKEALAWYLDGRVSVVAGTHTHVQTADDRILPRGTGYLTDLGMTGPAGSVIGVKSDICLARMRSQMPLRMEVAEGPSSISGALFDIDPESGRCVAVTRITDGIPVQ